MSRLDETKSDAGCRRIFWLQVLIALMVGSGVTAISAIVFCDRVIDGYVTENLDERARDSKEAFVHYPKQYPHEVSTAMQVSYSTSLLRAREYGWISEERFHKGAAIANLRACIINEMEGINERSEKFCKWAQQHWSKLDGSDDFASIRKREERFRERIQAGSKESGEE